MKTRISIFLLSATLVSCQSKQAEKSSADTTRAAATQPMNFKFSFYIGTTGLPEKPSDSWTMDTTGTTTIHTSHQVTRGNYVEQTGLAVLDPPDMDSLRMFIQMGKLYTIDSSNLNQQCAGDEHYVLKIIPLAALPYLSASFDACAANYNLLLEPQRRYFRAFIDWWERMRVKYRPVKLE